MNAIKFIQLVTMMSAILIMSCNNDSTTEETPEENLPDITGFPIVGTNQTTFFNNLTNTSTQNDGDDFYGQNANYLGNVPNYIDNEDGTVTDMVTGLMWQSSFDHNGDGSIDYDDKLTYDEILTVPSTVTTGGYTDWRVPSIKEQYSLIMFSGRDISSYQGTSTEGLTPFMNTDYFEFNYGDLDNNERLIDVQCATTNVYVSTEVENMVFGVNFADGRIKGYGMEQMGRSKAFNYLLVRGNETYGENSFTDNGDGTITDTATGLMWTQDDNAEAIPWQSALAYAEGKEYAGYTDWRLPDAKELQSIVDYTRSPATTNSPAIDPIFNCTQIQNEAGEIDYPWYWSSTTHATSSDENEGGWAAYVAFGRCMGNMGTTTWTDVHGAGAQRSDPKDGNPDEFTDGHGPQGDSIRIYNYVRLVRDTD
ncbi:DUF1566 domain-containing protein [Flavivirga aquimarina]|uniref:DUF1566 domain-containing protein n=1 Tax=Flavivirga aquimarina TaxID=2027862 RepID=A0ABT8WDT8_9FLAO|nr:DUF1566 domain-containing protein [Flavivirga aquimarina]MDO5971227.1 DUF1566 domain-containing protein [Flavivirga aquimarina]